MVATQLALVTSELFGPMGATQTNLRLCEVIRIHRLQTSPRVAEAESAACNLTGPYILVATVAEGLQIWSSDAPEQRHSAACVDPLFFHCNY